MTLYKRKPKNWLHVIWLSIFPDTVEAEYKHGFYNYVLIKSKESSQIYLPQDFEANYEPVDNFIECRHCLKKIPLDSKSSFVKDGGRLCEKCFFASESGLDKGGA